MKLRVGFLQFDVILGDRERNRSTLERLLDRIPSAEIPTVLAIPELWDVGYALTRAGELADAEGKNAAEYLGMLAKKHHVWFAGGTVLASIRNGFSNRALVVNPAGDLIEHYDKAHLIRLMDEDKYFVPGRRACLFSVGDIRCGVVTCYDIRFCEWLRTYALGGAKILFVGAEWPTSRIDHWETLLRARAIENQMYVVACNRCGRTGESAFGGKSMIIGPKGEILSRSGENEEIGVAEIDTEEVDKVRRFLTVFDDRVPELYKL